MTFPGEVTTYFFRRKVSASRILQVPGALFLGFFQKLFCRLLYSQSMTIHLLYLISQIISHMTLCANTYITKLRINGYGVIFRIIARKLANLQLFCILTSFLLEFRKITLKSIFSLFNICGIKFAECLPNIFSYPSELRYNVFLTSYNI